MTTSKATRDGRGYRLCKQSGVCGKEGQSDVGRGSRSKRRSLRDLPLVADPFSLPAIPDRGVEETPPWPEDPTVSGAARLTAAVAPLQTPTCVAYPTPAEPGPRDEIADLPPAEIVRGMPTANEGEERNR